MNNPAPYYRYRIEFRKLGDLRWIGHHDLARTVERIFRRLELPLKMSQGFHPKPKIRFASALALGIASDVEWVEVELHEPWDPDRLLAAVRQEAPSGLDFTRAGLSSGKMPQLETATYTIAVPDARREQLRQAVTRLWEARQCLIQRPGRAEAVDVRQGLRRIELRDGILEFTVAAGRRGAVRPREVLQVLQADDLESDGAILRRTSVTFDSDRAASCAESEAEPAASRSGASQGLDPLVLKSLDQPPS